MDWLAGPLARRQQPRNFIDLGLRPALRILEVYIQFLLGQVHQSLIEADVGYFSLELIGRWPFHALHLLVAVVREVVAVVGEFLVEEIRRAAIVADQV